MTPMRRAELVPSMVEWLNERFAPPGIRIGADTRLFADRLIDSIRILEIIAWVETAVGRRIPDREIRMDNFQTVERIARVFARDGVNEGGAGGGGAHVDR
jgi:acyl carrier protein